MKLLGIDFGQRRIGVAVSDELGMMALPLEQIDAQPLSAACARIAKITSEREIGCIVVGLPRNMDGSYGSSADAVREFVEQLKPLVSVSIVEWDERLTTAAAERMMLEADYSRKRRKEQRDALAAQLILQNYLDAHPEPEP